MNVSIRMYRQGLGDCFLLTFPTSDPKRSYYMLIDCGVVMGHKKERNGIVSPSFKQLADDIKKTTGGTIDLLVVTHEHYDHVIGFGNADANAVFRTMTVKDVWFAWTENPDDADATGLKERLKKTSNALRMAISTASPEAMQPISSVLDFMGAADGKAGG
ncbi:MAG TPA: MBL fold metallo-hydrolase, partial [Bacteroidota bacterium]